ncbi:TIGR03619 family F420-dependent LLM class oxidoreductase [Amycolatopsis sp. NPDC088138]|uniref:TIGR03619 family F420-dependent LLM class oxidoreductase n=1 Tax=Amycolatopsis sp. NPDC088138 TaxID=3363938 RepID=UPI003800B120
MTKFGLTLPQDKAMDLRHDVALVAREAEAAGYRSLWTYERSLFPLEPADGMYGVPGLPWDEGYRSTAEAHTVLTVAATVTSTVRVGSALLVAGMHAPLHLARSLATLDQLTGGGRVVVGLGGGWSSDEFRAGGADFAHRGKHLDEMVDALGALWGPDPVSYEDSRITVDNALVSPKPVAPIPVLLGGGYSKQALDRIARKADGWIPTSIPPEALAGMWQGLQDLAAGHGRPAGAVKLFPLESVYLTGTDAGADRLRGVGSINQIVDDLAAMAAVGAEEIIIAVHGATSGKDLVEKSGRLMDALKQAGLAD